MDYFAKLVRLPDSWSENTRISVSTEGDITGVLANSDSQGAEVIDGIIIPAMPNLHSHAFQRAMAGCTEHSVPGENNFWSWRDAMYSLANNITPDQLYQVAAQLYVELLKNGYTSVTEFHYLHNRENGLPYDDKGVMSEAIINAASVTGIGLTLLPVLYMYSDFCNKPPVSEQQRFINDVDSYADLLSLAFSKNNKQTQSGIGFHSLRAVSVNAMQEILTGFSNYDTPCPIHIHIAEQPDEVNACIENYKQRPVEFLFENFAVDENWCLVHATHASEQETRLIAKANATVGLCPTTEANLGDGLFPIENFLGHGGLIGIGSDSHVTRSPAHELRLLEYGQRLVSQKRNLCNSDELRHTGSFLWNTSLNGGARTSGRKIGDIKTGNRADFLVLDELHPDITGKKSDYILDSFVFTANDNPVKDVMCGGKWVVRDGCHINETEIRNSYTRVMNTIQF